MKKSERKVYKSYLFNLCFLDEWIFSLIPTFPRACSKNCIQGSVRSKTKEIFFKWLYHFFAIFLGKMSCINLFGFLRKKIINFLRCLRKKKCFGNDISWTNGRTDLKIESRNLIEIRSRTGFGRNPIHYSARTGRKLRFYRFFYSLEIGSYIIFL